MQQALFFEIMEEKKRDAVKKKCFRTTDFVLVVCRDSKNTE